MDGFKEFQGKDLDSAIAEACGYFDAPRERLEIEILQDAKTGIFGIVGARKAKVRARRAHVREAVESVLGPRGAQRGRKAPADAAPGRPIPRDAQPGDDAAQPKKPRDERRPKAEPVAEPASGRAPHTAPGTTPAPGAETRAAAPAPATPQPTAPQGLQREPEPGPEEAAAAAPHAESHRQPAGRPRSRAPRPTATNAPGAPGAPGVPDSPAASAPTAEPPRAPHEPAPHDLDGDDAPEGLPRTPLEDLDPERLKSLTEETVRELVRPITGGRVPVSVRVEDGRVHANVDWSGDAGLLIGREGQTLAALQYLASRMVSRGMNAAVRIQLDIGDYRLRQDEKLRAVALSLAEKARATGRAYSTRPLSSYHRRIIHLCLQDADDLQTRSSGEGPLKRVVISRRKPEDA